MSLMAKQNFVTPKRPLPVDVMDQGSQVVNVAAETVQMVVASTNVNDAGSAAGTVVYFRLANSGVMDSSKIGIGSSLDTSFSFGTGTILTTLVEFPWGVWEEGIDASRATKMATVGALFTNGQYAIDHRSGFGIGKKATTGTSDTGAYSYRATVTAITGTITATTAAPTTGTESNIASSASSVTLLAANTSRIAASVFNDSTQVLYLLLGSGTASATNYTVQLLANDYYEVPWPSYTGIIKGIWASANGNARVTELT